jgi:hypothetical protein
MRVALREVRDQVRVDLSGPAGSRAGGPPGKVDGDLIKAIRYSVRTKGDLVLGAVGVLKDPDQAAKGARLAGGFAGKDRNGRMYSEAPRPWLVPVVRRNSKRIVDHITRGG